MLECPALPTTIYKSTFHLLRPYLRSSVELAEETEGDEGEGGGLALLGTWARGRPAESGGDGVPGGPALEGPRWTTSLRRLVAPGLVGLLESERADVERDLRVVQTRLPVRLHSMLQLLSSLPPRGNGGRESPPPPAFLSLQHLVEVDGLLEALVAEQEGSDAEEELLEYRVGLFRLLLAWIVFLEHVDAVALSADLRDAYSTYVAVMGIVPLLLQVDASRLDSVPPSLAAAHCQGLNEVGLLMARDRWLSGSCGVVREPWTCTPSGAWTRPPSTT